MAVTRFIALSVAATGRSYTDGHRVTELWLQKVDGNSLGPSLSLQFAKPKETPDGKHLRFADTAQTILDFIGDSTLVCHDAEYHIGYLNYELINAEYRTVNSPIICTLDLCRKHGVTEKNPDIICGQMGLTPRGRSIQAEAYQAAAIYLSLSHLPLPVFPPCSKGDADFNRFVKKPRVISGNSASHTGIHASGRVPPSRLKSVLQSASRFWNRLSNDIEFLIGVLSLVFFAILFSAGTWWAMTSQNPHPVKKATAATATVETQRQRKLPTRVQPQPFDQSRAFPSHMYEPKNTY